MVTSELADISAAEAALSVAEAEWDAWDAPRRREFLSELAALLGHEHFLRATFAHVRVMRAQLDELPYEAVADTLETEAEWDQSMAGLLADPGEWRRVSEAVVELEAALSLHPTNEWGQELQRDRIVTVLAGSSMFLQ
jgi:hypothetical protein